MSDNELTHEGEPLTRLQQHRFMLLVGGTILISLFLVSVAMALYASSGAAQLDLSRPDYKSVREQTVNTNTFKEFPSTGALDKKALDQFRTEYDKQIEKATKINSFGGDALSDQVLSIDAVDTAAGQ